MDRQSSGRAGSGAGTQSKAPTEQRAQEVLETPLEEEWLPPLHGNHKQQKEITQLLRQRLKGSQESLYFVLRGLGMAATKGSDGALHVEVDRKCNPTLFAALSRVGSVRREGELLVVDAIEGDTANDTSSSAKRRPGSAPPKPQLVRVRAPCAPHRQLHAASMHSAKMLQGRPSLAGVAMGAGVNETDTVTASRLPMQQGASAAPRRPRSMKPAASRLPRTGGQPSVGSQQRAKSLDPGPVRSVSAPALKRAEADELCRRLAQPRWAPPRERSEGLLHPREALGFCHAEASSGTANKAVPEAQQKHCALLSQPKIKPEAEIEKDATAPERGAVDPDVQRLHCERLARPRPKREDRPSPEWCATDHQAQLGDLFDASSRPSRPPWRPPLQPQQGNDLGGIHNSSCSGSDTAWVEKAERLLDGFEESQLKHSAGRPHTTKLSVVPSLSIALGASNGFVGWQLARGCVPRVAEVVIEASVPNRLDEART